MIKIDNKVTIWKSSDFNWPVRNNNNYSLIQFNHNLNLHIDKHEIMVKTEESPVLRYDYDSQATGSYGYRAYTATLNSVTLQLFRLANSSVESYAFLISYGNYI